MIDVFKPVVPRIVRIGHFFSCDARTVGASVASARVDIISIIDISWPIMNEPLKPVSISHHAETEMTKDSLCAAIPFRSEQRLVIVTAWRSQ